eukprot:1482449-Rhodomonas_salina.1
MGTADTPLMRSSKPRCNKHQAGWRSRLTYVDCHARHLCRLYLQHCCLECLAAGAQHEAVHAG